MEEFIMKALLIVLLAFLFVCLLNPFAYALSERCIEIAQKSGLDLNEAECYVLERVEKGEVAHFKVSDNWNTEKYQEKFSKKEDRALRADFLSKLLTLLRNFRVAPSKSV